MEGAEFRFDSKQMPLPSEPRLTLWRTFRRLLRVWAARDFERSYLLTLDDGQLWSMRLTKEDARQLARRPFWRE